MTAPVIAWSEWEPIYAAIVADFEYDRSADEAARDALAALVGDRSLVPADLPSLADHTVAVAGPVPLSDDAIARVRTADAVVTTGSAASTFPDAGIEIDLHVTDLDDDPDVVCALTETGVPVAVHAHGDNRSELARIVPQLVHSAVLPTSQVAPTPTVANLGGFTDGDRAAFLACALGARTLCFPGWDLDDPTVSSIKRRKLRWAGRLLYWLERRVGTHFPILDGRRDGIDIETFPAP